ncbi:MAG: hypothetical protein SF053_00595 [Bacteroidia bacterium]|nr:hypothetical protein [Bacteroidia bacterium]
MSKLFLIGIGGTGMRCLESFIHLCAIGMMDEKEVHLLAIDTDHQNGNLNRLDQLISRYIAIRTYEREQAPARKDGYFTARINYYKYNTELSQKEGLITLSDKAGIRPGTVEKELADLLFSEDVQRLDLTHGYRGQTHMGSLLIYHELIDEVKKQIDLPPKDQVGKLVRFLKELRGETDARIFITGSIFGGTGASSLPVIPKFIKDAMMLFEDPQPIDKDVEFGGTLLSSYFRFNVDDTQKKREKIIADSAFFGLNSQTALIYYHDDPAISKNFQYLYHIGWPINATNFHKEEAGKTLTGGMAQENPSHPTELLSAFAAINFFERPSIATEARGSHTKYYRSANRIDQYFDFTFGDFSDGTRETLFEARLGTLFGFAFLLNSNSFKGDLSHFLSNVNESIDGYYSSLSERDIKPLEDFLKRFAFSISDSFVPGWLFELQKSAQYDAFLFEAFAFDSSKIKTFNWGSIYKSEERKFSFQRPVKGIKLPWRKSPDYSDAFDHFKDLFVKTYKDERALLDRITNPKERILKHLYITLHKAYNFE